MAVTALAYALAGVLALQLAIPPAFASPLYPPAGIALAAVLVHGWRMLPGVALGSLLVNLTLNAQRGQADLTAFTVPAAIALGAALQAGLGAWLVRRYVRQPLTLGEPRDIALFFGLGAALACVVNAGLATWALARSGAVPASAMPITWLTWWAGDTLGVLIGAPIALTLIGRPSQEWASRRLTVGLTLFLMTAFIAAGIAQVAHWDKERARNAFERDADNASSAVRAQLQEPLHALEALRGVFIASDEVTQDEMQRATRAWLEPGNFVALGWSERMRRRDVPDFEARVRAQGLLAYRVYDRTDAGEPATEPGADDPVVAIRHIEPLLGNGGALGVNALSIPVARAAIEQAGRTGAPQVTAGFRLTQHLDSDDQTGVVIYAAIYAGAPTTEAERQRAARGVVFVTLRLDTLLGRLQPGLPPDLRLCLVDADPSASRRRIAGLPGCEMQRADMRHVRPLAYAGRQWDLHVYSNASDAARSSDINAWLFAVVGLLAASLLGALMLTVTGRARRIEEAVQLRTAALQAEILEREQAQAALHDAEKACELAEASNRAKSDFLSRMSHELRTPLNAILGFAQLLELDKRHPLVPEQRPWVGRIQHAGWHLLEMINDVLDLSRIESGSLRLQPEPLDLGRLVADVLPMVRADAQERAIAISTRLDGATASALGDATRVRQIVINLLSNAVKYNVDGGSIDVSCSMQGLDAVQVAVTDSGIGMTPQQHAELFTPFNRLGQERSAREGTGIGLVISKSLAEAMGGTLRGDPSPGGGTTFVLTLPVAGSDGPAAAGHHANQTAPRYYGERVVHYIEDNETNVEVMRGVLALRPQVRMEVSVNGAEALRSLRALQAEAPDLILLDMHLPDTTGLELLRLLKADPRLALVPVVAVSADAVPDNVDAALRAGAVGYLTKPLEVSKFLALLDQHFAASSGARRFGLGQH